MAPRKRTPKGAHPPPREKPILQVALDVLELPRALQIARESIAGGVDWLEAGTPLLKSVGMDGLRALKKEFPGRTLVADMKVMDTGALEVEMAAKSGAGVVTLLGACDDSTLADAVRAARKYGARVMVDLLNVPDPVARARQAEALGADCLCIHVGIDQQMVGMSPLETLRRVAREASIPVAAAGGLDADTAAEAAAHGAKIIIVGGHIARSAHVTESARAIRRAIDKAKADGQRREPEVDALHILRQVSTPNISDAMHRAPAMRDIRPLTPGQKVVGPAVTIQTFEGDWAKTVEAIDIARPGDVLVIYNGSRYITCWGELASHSAQNRRIAGLVIDGPVRDVDDIVKMGFPVFCSNIVPNAGEPKGFGEINAEITCGGLKVRPGDIIVGDDHGVLVVPKERALEIARRAMEVKKNEDRVREEIRRGATLAQVADLYKWEKK
ncbi:MAG: orotidine 5'-phosphate decarboxylase [Euryarchaeota archaeon]|nr:orotidine 5'-phosphate decarboxylase [Euryarchaeota archaeon]